MPPSTIPTLAIPHSLRAYGTLTRAKGVRAGYSGSFVSILVVLVYSIIPAGSWPKQLGFCISGPPREGEEFEVGANILGHFIRTSRRVRCYYWTAVRASWVMHATSIFFLDVFVETFCALTPRSIEYSDAMPRRLEERPTRGVKNIYRARALRWTNVK